MLRYSSFLYSARSIVRVALVASAVFMFSCQSSDKKSDDVQTADSATGRERIDTTIPVITDLDVGINAKKNDLHIEAELSAVKKIDRVVVTLKGDNWTKDITFDQAPPRGELTTNFHQHVHVDEAPAGEYQVILTLHDQEGREAKAEGSFVK